jgi:hypothetical protein
VLSCALRLACDAAPRTNKSCDEDMGESERVCVPLCAQHAPQARQAAELGSHMQASFVITLTPFFHCWGVSSITSQEVNADRSRRDAAVGVPSCPRGTRWAFTAPLDINGERMLIFCSFCHHTLLLCASTRQVMRIIAIFLFAFPSSLTSSCSPLCCTALWPWKCTAGRCESGQAVARR